MDAGRCNLIICNELAPVIDLDMIFVSKESLSIFLGPVCIQIFLFKLIGFVLPIFRNVAFTNLFVFFTGITLSWDLYDGSINDSTVF